jgi:molybdate transport system substrate-binding protein
MNHPHQTDDFADLTRWHFRPDTGMPVRAIACITALLLTLNVFLPAAFAGEARIAVAANFSEAARAIAGEFSRASGHETILSFGSTGQLYTQISQGAPFDVFLAADQQRPQLAVKENFAVSESRFTYATGSIVLYSIYPDLVEGESTLEHGNFNRIAIANPGTAPYGMAAVETLQHLGVYRTLQDKIVQGNNIAQAYQFVETGNAEIGFVALSQVASHNDGSRWYVPKSYYSVIAQDAVLLKRGADNDVAIAFLAFLQSAKARMILERFGYGIGK